MAGNADDDPLTYVVAKLSSSSVDAWSVNKRNEWIDSTTKRLTESSAERETLAGLTDINCTSRHAYSRLVGLFVSAIVASIDDNDPDSIQQSLVQILCQLLKQSNNAKLVQSCQSKLNKIPQDLLQKSMDTNPVAMALLTSTDNIDWSSIVQATCVDDSPTSPLAFRPLLQNIPLQVWQEQIGPSLIVKFKAKPEKLINTIQEWITSVAPSVLVRSNVVPQEFVPFLQKQLSSSKDHIRDCAANMLGYIATMAGSIGLDDSETTAVKDQSACLSSIISVLGDSKVWSLGPQRQTVATTWNQIANNILKTSPNKTILTSKTISTILSSIVDLLAKESKAGTVARDQGVQALWQWIVISNEIGTEKGFNDAWEYARKPVELKNTAETISILGPMVELVPFGLLSAIVEQLYKENKFQKGIEGLVESAQKKQSSSIAPVDGLIAVYLAATYASSASKSLPSYIDKVLSTADSSSDKPSFIYSQTITDAVVTNPIVALVLPQIIVLYNTKLDNKGGSKKNSKASTKSLVSCVTHPVKSPDHSATLAMEKYLSAFIESANSPAKDESTLKALFLHINELSLSAQEWVEGLNSTRQAREATSLPTNTIKGKGSPTASHGGMDTNAVRRAAKLFLSNKCTTASLPIALIAMHVGTSLNATRKQRAALIKATTQAIVDVVVTTQWDKMDEFVHPVANIVAECASLAESTTFNVTISEMIHKASVSLLSTLGGIACQYTPDIDDVDEDPDLKPNMFAHLVCTKEIPEQLAKTVETVRVALESMTETDIDMYKSPPGVPFKPEISLSGGSSGAEKKSKGRMTEDEEWELQMKKEIAAKKAKEATSTGPTTLSADDKKLVQEQDEERKKLTKTICGDYPRVMDSIRYLALSDIEVGNACLPLFSRQVLSMAVSKCPAMEFVSGLSKTALDTLATLATCVYEIPEEYGPMMATALVISCSKGGDNKESEKKEDDTSKSDNTITLNVSALPSPCEPAATTIFEMDEFQDELSPGSFAFLFPVIRASLMGPRTTPGCEGALRVLERHTGLLTQDPIIKSLRKDMIVSVLELLKHDRSQTFVDPNPYDTLVACFQTPDDDDDDEEEKNGGGSKGPALSTAEMAALLDERGALGSKNCRVGAMMALGAIASKHLKLVKNNPLIENRIWLNCFDKNESIRHEARRTLGIVHGNADLDTSDDSLLPPPSMMYAVPLLPLLSNEDESIAMAAADAYARGMEMYPKSVNRNVQKLCSTYIEAFPVKGDSGKSASASPALPTALPSKKPVAAAAPKKKTTGVPASLKKKTVKKSALEVAGIGQPKKSAKKKTAHAALLKPKQERTMDQDMLANQFKSEGTKVKEEKDSASRTAARIGVLNAVTALTSTNVEMDMETITLLTGFLMAYGLADSNETVKSSARNALRDIVASNGGSDEAIAFLLPQLDKVLKDGVVDDDTLGTLSTEKVPRYATASDWRKEGAVLALGSVAFHLKGPENVGKIDTTIDMLLQSLKTPSEDVQSSVADCLVKLMKKGNTQERIETILNDLLHTCLNGDPSSTRRGAAYGLSAAIKGSGIGTLKKYGIVTKLEEACSSGSSSMKEGSLFAMELLTARLGLLFEPYVIVLLPALLQSFSDGSDHVRKAASKCVGLIMSKLSAHGVKLVMPAVLTAFEDKSWRTKQASIHMLGSMCHLAPKQLASALPKVVPKLTEAFADTHPKVKSSAQDALDEISTVIRNPEISSISPVLLRALTDPAESTIKALEALIETEFLHAIDAPSLALIVPILHRGLRDRGASTKRYGALIAGNICTMINDPRDFVPYIPTLLPDLKVSLLDPIPDVRSISAKALGSLTRGLGEATLPDLRPWLVEKLRSEEVSSAERSGAAQGLTELLIASGTSTVESVMYEEILQLRNHPQASTREGVLWVLTFLPPALGQGFTPMLDASLPALIGGLSDENEQVREVAMRAGRVLIKSHGRVHVEKILPSLENGLTDEDHRIRVSSLMLLGDLLSMIGGTAVLRTDGDTQDDIRRAERAQAQITLALGLETRNRVLSEVYLARNDSAVLVRQNAVQVWKTVVSVTARTLRQILSVLVKRVVTDLASGNPEKTDVAGRCLGDVVSKLGDSVLPEIIPVLRNALYDGDNFTRRGVCVGLSEVIQCSTRDQILRFIDIIVKVVEDALCDDDEDVREMAAAGFQSLHSLVGSIAMDEIVPSLMVALENSGNDERRSGRALNGLTGILSVRSRELLPYIIPRLSQTPITINHAKAMSRITEVTETTIYLHFNTIIPAIIGDLATMNGQDSSREEAVRECATSMCTFVGQIGVNTLVSNFSSKCNSDKAEIRRESCWLVETMVNARKELQDFYEQIPVLIRELVYRFNDENTEVLKAAHKAFAALSTVVPAEELVKHVEFMRNLISSMVSDARRRKGGVGDGEFLLPGFNMPKGLEPLLPIYQRGILYGTPVIREASAAGLGEVIALTSTKFLAGPVIIKMTGPLLRIVGDRNPSNVKIAILRTLGLILTKGGPALRAFVPQFQTTFVKALSDPARQVRLEAIKALGLLMPLSTRVDPLIKELVAGSLGRSGGDDSEAVPAVQTATLEALAVVLSQGGKKAKLPDTVPSSLAASKELFAHNDSGVREGAAKVMGAACDLLGLEETIDVVRENILSSDDDSGSARHGQACAIRYVLCASFARDLDGSLLESLKNKSLEFIKDDKDDVQEAGCVAIGAAVGRAKSPSACLRGVEATILALINDTKVSLDVHRSVAKGLCLALQLSDDVESDRITFMGLPLLEGCLKLAMSGAQRVQFAYNDVLWLALDVQEGQEGLDKYSSLAMFDKAKQMKSVYTKVLVKIKKLTLLDD